MANRHGETQELKVGAPIIVTEHIVHILTAGDKKNVVYSLVKLPIGGRFWLGSARTQDANRDIFDVTLAFPLNKIIANLNDFRGFETYAKQRIAKQLKILYWISIAAY